MVFKFFFVHLLTPSLTTEMDIFRYIERDFLDADARSFRILDQNCRHLDVCPLWAIARIANVITQQFALWTTTPTMDFMNESFFYVKKKNKDIYRDFHPHLLISHSLKLGLKVEKQDVMKTKLRDHDGKFNVRYFLFFIFIL